MESEDDVESRDDEVDDSVGVTVSVGREATSSVGRFDLLGDGLASSVGDPLGEGVVCGTGAVVAAGCGARAVESGSTAKCGVCSGSFVWTAATAVVTAAPSATTTAKLAASISGAFMTPA